MLEKRFNQIKSGIGRSELMGAEVAIIHFGNSGNNQEISETFVMTKVTGLTDESIYDIAEASVNAVKSARGES